MRTVQVTIEFNPEVDELSNHERQCRALVNAVENADALRALKHLLATYETPGKGRPAKDSILPLSEEQLAVLNDIRAKCAPYFKGVL